VRQLGAALAVRARLRQFHGGRILPKRTPSSAKYDKIACKSNEFAVFRLVPSLQVGGQHL
jgi:hypothetical protein